MRSIDCGLSHIKQVDAPGVFDEIGRRLLQITLSSVNSATTNTALFTLSGEAKEDLGMQSDLATETQDRQQFLRNFCRELHRGNALLNLGLPLIFSNGCRHRSER